MSRLREPADWSKDSPETLRERRGYWMTGFGTGPDTTMAVLWGSALVLVASQDGVCAPFNGMSSGSDGAACVATGDWNSSAFELAGGSACLGVGILGEDTYLPDPSLAGCLAAFEAYRAAPGRTNGAPFTCNCSGPATAFTFISGGGMRPSNAFNLAQIGTLVLVAIASPLIGAMSDYSSRKLYWWKVLCFIGAFCNFGMMALAPGGLWWIGLAFGVLTGVFTEIMIPIRSSYMDEVADDNATRGYLGGMRQFASYLAQLVYVILMVVPILIFSSQLGGIVVAGVCAVWYMLSMPYFLRFMREHPARRTKPDGANACTLTFGVILDETRRLFSQYPNAGLFLVAHMCAQFGAPIFITLVSTYLPAQLGVTNIIQVNVIAIVVLLVGCFSTLAFARLMKRDAMTFKTAWMVVLGLDVLIGALTPVVAADSSFMSYLLLVILAGVVGAVAISWFYSLGWPSFCSMIPTEEIGAYNGIFCFWNNAVQPFATLIYFGVVQGTNSHRLAWGITVTPFCALSLVLMCFVNFDKALADSGRKGTKGTSSTTPESKVEA